MIICSRLLSLATQVLVRPIFSLDSLRILFWVMPNLLWVVISLPKLSKLRAVKLELNFGIQQDKKDSKLWLEPSIREHKDVFWFMISQVKNLLKPWIIGWMKSRSKVKLILSPSWWVTSVIWKIQEPYKRKKVNHIVKSLKLASMKSQLKRTSMLLNLLNKSVQPSWRLRNLNSSRKRELIQRLKILNNKKKLRKLFKVVVKILLLLNLVVLVTNNLRQDLRAILNCLLLLYLLLKRKSQVDAHADHISMKGRVFSSGQNFT